MLSSKASKSETAKVVAAKTVGRLYFLDLAAGRILTSNPDGSNLKTIVNEGRRLPDGIVVDVAGGHIYWTNMGNSSGNDGSIDRADFDGGNITNVVPAGSTFTPKQLQLDAKNRKTTGAIATACESCQFIFIPYRMFRALRSSGEL